MAGCARNEKLGLSEVFSHEQTMNTKEIYQKAF